MNILDQFGNCCHGGYGATFTHNDNTKISSISLEDVKNLYNIDKFNVLVADCEGFLEQFFQENFHIADDLRLILFEADYPEKCNYEKIKHFLRLKGFQNLVDGHQNIWRKS